MKQLTKIIILFLSMVTVGYATTSGNGTVATEDKPAIIVSESHPEFTIKLKSNPTTGYSWFLRSFDSNLIHPVRHNFEAPTGKKLMGAPGFDIWTFHVKPAGFAVPQQTAIRFIYARPWNSSDQTRQVVFTVTTQEKKMP